MFSVGKTLKRFLRENRWTCFASTCWDTQLGYRNRLTVRAETSAMPWAVPSMQDRKMACQESTNAIANDSEKRKVENGTNCTCTNTQAPCMCCHLPTLRCTTLYVVISCTPYTGGSATPPRARALAPNRKTSHAPVKRKGKKYTLPLNVLTKRNPPRCICRRLWCGASFRRAAVPTNQ